MQEDYEFDDDEFTKSKTQLKQEMQALQDLGVAITKLTKEQQSKIPMSESLRSSIEEAPKIKSNSAKRRHMQFIGKLMRKEDQEEIRQAYDSIMEASHTLTRLQHSIEKWRDDLIQDGSQMETFISRHPDVDRQQLRQLIRAAQKEKTENKPPANARKLFRFLRDTIEANINN